MEAIDILEIHHLVALYGHVADDAPNHTLLPQVFTADAVWEAPAEDFADAGVPVNRFEGIAAILAMFQYGVPPNSPSHHTTNIWVREEGGQVKAKSKWIAHPEKESIWVGDYDDVVVKTPDGWRIKHRIATFRYGKER